jgi:hypothetical protein
VLCYAKAESGSLTYPHVAQAASDVGLQLGDMRFGKRKHWFLAVRFCTNA